MADYHGLRPQTKDDAKIAKKHLKDTQDLLEDKIDDHDKAAEDNPNPKSAAYHRSHAQNHKKDLKEVNTSLKTLKNIKPAVMMPVKKSSGLANYLTKKRVGAKAMAKG